MTIDNVYNLNVLNISVSSSLRRFTTVYKADLPSNDQKTLTGVTPVECATACNQETGFHCRSFDYDNSAKKCFLSQAYRDIVSISSGDNNIKDYYELSKFLPIVLIITKKHDYKFRIIHISGVTSVDNWRGKYSYICVHRS